MISQPIQGGTRDVSGLYDGVVQVRVPEPDGKTGVCSGVLISPRVVVTAVHCIDEGINGVETTVTVRVGLDPDDPDQEVDHTFSRSGAIQSMHPHFCVDPLDNNDVARDIALIILDEPVERYYAKPFEAPVQIGNCSSDFDGVIAGTSTSNWDVIATQNQCEDGYGEERRFATTGTWHRSGQPGYGSVYLEETIVHMMFPCAWDGSAGGDSGGALFDDTGKLCGILSNVRPWPGGQQLWSLEMAAAVLDSAEAISFVQQHSRDPRGDYIGECPAYRAACDAVTPFVCSTLYEIDTDGDGVWDICDTCPDNWNPDQVFAVNDPDNDGIETACDNCPTVTNVLQTDNDGDGIGNVCDPCPCFPYPDTDGDGICDVECNGPDDNCPSVANPLQRNCNLVSEMEHAPDEIWGDACDPVPCAREEDEPTTIVLSDQQSGDMTWRMTLTLRDEIDVYPLASHGAPWTNVFPVAVPMVETPYRYCFKKPWLGLTCEESVNIQDARLNDSVCGPTTSDPSPCFNSEHRLDAFHRITFAQGGNGFSGYAPEYDYDRIFNSPGTPHQLTWRFQEDLSRWLFAGFWDPDSQPPQYEALNGTFWIHADTNFGAFGGPTGAHADQLSNNHLHNFKPEDFQEFFRFHLAEQPARFFIWLTLPDPWTPPFRRWDGQIGESSIVVSSAEEWGAIDLDGDVQVITDKVGAEFAAGVMNDPTTVWANASEPLAHLGGAALPYAIGLSPDGTIVRDLVYMDGEGIRGINDVGGSFPTVTGSPDAVDFQLVFSRSARAAFAVGGNDPASGEPTGQIRVLSLDNYSWSPSVGPELNTVLAATYSFVTNELFVLDSAGQSATLYGVTLQDGSWRQVGTWTRGANWAHHWLTVDVHGKLLLSSSDGVGAYAIAQIDVSQPGAPVVDGRLSGSKPLLLGTVVDVAGYTVLQAEPDNQVSLVRSSALTLSPAEWVDLEDQL